MATRPLLPTQHDMPAPIPGRQAVPSQPATLPNPTSSAPSPSATVSSLAEPQAAVRALPRPGRAAEAPPHPPPLPRTFPTEAEPGLQLLALDPSPAEEIDLIEQFLRQHPAHRFAAAMRARL